MHLSDSEAFWLATIYEEFWGLTHRVFPMGEPRELPIASKMVGQEDAAALLPIWAVQRPTNPCSPDEEAEAEQDFGRDVYAMILKAAIDFGVVGACDWQIPADRIPVTPPSDIRWGGCLGDEWAAEECDSLRVALEASVGQAREALMLQADAGDGIDSFEASLRMAECLSFVGYAPSAPRRLYCLGADGQVYVKAEVTPRSRGLYASLMKLFESSLPLPAEERMAMAEIDQAFTQALRKWVPSSQTLDRPCGECDCAEVARHLDEFRRSNAASDAWKIGRCLAYLRNWMSERSEVLRAHVSHESSGEQRTSTAAVQHEADAGKQEATWIADDADHDDDTSGSFMLRIVRRICDRALASEEDVGGIPPDEAYYEEERRNGMVGDIREFHRLAEVAISLAEQRNLVSVAEMVRTAKSSLPDSVLVMQGRWKEPESAKGLYRLAGEYGRMSKLLDDAAKVAYGELRLRGLAWDEHAVAPPALTGWAGQTDNVREAIRVAIDQLNNGLKPYVVLTQLAPAVQSLVRELASRHLDNFTGLNTGGMLRVLQTKVQDTNDEDLRVVVRVADALNTLRNRVVHEDSIDWDRDHAAFFLNGLSILLRSV